MIIGLAHSEISNGTDKFPDRKSDMMCCLGYTGARHFEPGLKFFKDPGFPPVTRVAEIRLDFSRALSRRTLFAANLQALLQFCSFFISFFSVFGLE
jgi:hypothetical protein